MNDKISFKNEFLLYQAFGFSTNFEKVAKEKGILFEIRPKENGHNIPHCHAKYQDKEISISLNDCSVLAGNLDKQKEKFAIDFVRNNLSIFQQHWDKFHKIVF